MSTYFFVFRDHIKDHYARFKSVFSRFDIILNRGDRKYILILEMFITLLLFMLVITKKGLISYAKRTTR